MSTLVTRFGINARQAAFVDAYLNSGDAQASSLASGYAHGNDGYRILQLPHVLAAMHAEVQRRIVATEAPASLRVLGKLRDDDATPARVRADIGLQFLKMAGHVVPTHKADKAQKQLSEMTQSELLDYIEKNQAEIDRAEGELAAKAKDVSAQDNAQDSPSVEAKPLAWLE